MREWTSANINHENYWALVHLAMYPPKTYHIFQHLHIRPLMSFQCFVCDQRFKRAQDRSTHIRQKKDESHRKYTLQQEKHVTTQFSAAVQATTSAAAAVFYTRPLTMKVPSSNINDVDQDDLPSSRDMNIDLSDTSDPYLDEEGSIVSEDDQPVEDTEDVENEEVLANFMEAAALALDGVDLEEIGKVFSFLPNPDLEDVAEGKAGPGPSTAIYRANFQCTFINGTDSRTYQWHPTAGKVLRQEPVTQAHWQSLFSGEDSSGDSEYKPFSGRLDWELAQWAVQEKIPHKSFDHLLKIPQVVYL